MAERQTETDAARATDCETRRDVLQKMGKYAAYTAPTLIALTLPEESQAARRAGRGRGRRGGGGWGSPGRGPRPHTSR